MSCPCGRSHTPQSPGPVLEVGETMFCGPACLTHGRRWCNGCGRPTRDLVMRDDGRCMNCFTAHRPAHGWCLA